MVWECDEKPEEVEIGIQENGDDMLVQTVFSLSKGYHNLNINPYNITFNSK